MDGVGSSTQRAVTLMFELIGDHDEDALTLVSTTPRDTDSSIDGAEYEAQVSQYRSLVSSIRERYIRFADRSLRARSDADTSVRLVACHERASRFLRREGFDETLSGSPGDVESRTVEALREVVTWVFAEEEHGEALDALHAALDRTRHRLAKEIGVLGLSIEQHDGTTTSLGEYLFDLLVRLWWEGSDFDAKRPFGSTDWQQIVYRQMIRHGFVAGTLDEHGDVIDVDHGTADLLIEQAIRQLGASPSRATSQVKQAEEQHGTQTARGGGHAD